MILKCQTAYRAQWMEPVAFCSDRTNKWQGNRCDPDLLAQLAELYRVSLLGLQELRVLAPEPLLATWPGGKLVHPSGTEVPLVHQPSRKFLRETLRGRS